MATQAGLRALTASSGCVFQEASAGEIRSFLPQELSQPRASFILYEIYFTSRSVWEQPIGEEALFAPCLSSAPVCLLLSLVHFKGIAMMRVLKGGNLSMYQICWEASESEVQLHRHGALRGETGLRTSEAGGEGARNFLFPSQLSIVCDRVQKVHCHYFCTYKYLMRCKNK